MANLGYIGCAVLFHPLAKPQESPHDHRHEDGD